MNDNYLWRPEWIKSPGWIFAEVPDAVRAELESCINERGDDARPTLGGHLEQSWHLPIRTVSYTHLTLPTNREV